MLKPLNPRNRIHIGYTLCVFLYAAFLAAIVVVANLRLAPWIFAVPSMIPLGDKFCHLILMGLFSFLLNSALNCRRVTLKGDPILLGSLIAYALVFAEEVSQFWVESRNVEVLDIIFDVVGIYLFAELAVRNMSQKEAGETNMMDEHHETRTTPSGPDQE